MPGTDRLAHRMATRGPFSVVTLPSDSWGVRDTDAAWTTAEARVTAGPHRQRPPRLATAHGHCPWPDGGRQRGGGQGPAHPVLALLLTLGGMGRALWCIWTPAAGPGSRDAGRGDRSPRGASPIPPSPTRPRRPATPPCARRCTAPRTACARRERTPRAPSTPSWARTRSARWTCCWWTWSGASGPLVGAVMRLGGDPRRCWPRGGPAAGHHARR